MEALATTTLSSKGQIVIPEAIRNRLGLQVGMQFVVVGDKDTVIMKTITRPDMRSFDTLIRESRRQARASGLKRSDVTRAIAKARGRG